MAFPYVFENCHNYRTDPLRTDPLKNCGERGWCEGCAAVFGGDEGELNFPEEIDGVVITGWALV